MAIFLEIAKILENLQFSEFSNILSQLIFWILQYLDTAVSISDFVKPTVIALSREESEVKDENQTISFSEGDENKEDPTE